MSEKPIPNPMDYSARISKNRASSLRYALRGALYMLRYQKNIRLIIGGTIFAIAMGAWLDISTSEWAPIALAIGMVWALEFVNGAIEAAVNLVGGREYHPMAGIAKDVAAGAVLIGVITAVVVGIILFGPPLLGKIF